MEKLTNCKCGGGMAMEQKLVKLFTSDDNLQAEMIINTLKDNDIPALKEDLGNAGLMNLYGGNSKYGENIYVAEDNYAKVKEILSNMGFAASNLHENGVNVV